MPGYVIHLAVAKEYLKKSKNRNENEEEFINGVIFPDSVKDKAITHYGEKSSKSNLYEFLKDKKSLETIYKAGADKANYMANKTLRKVQKKIGLIPR